MYIMKPVTFIKLYSETNAVRGDVVFGQAKAMPMVGKSFSMYAEPIDKSAAFRYISTSIVTSVEKDLFDDVYIIRTTTGSIYRLDFSMPVSSNG